MRGLRYGYKECQYCCFYGIQKAFKGGPLTQRSESKGENEENTFFSLKLQSLCCSPRFGWRVTTIVVRTPELVELPPGEALLIVLLEYSEEAFDSSVELDFKTFVCLDTV